MPPVPNPRVLLLETIEATAMDALARSTDVIVAYDTDERGVLTLAETGPVHAIVTRGKGQVRTSLIDACPDLVAIARCGVGLDNIDVPAATRRGVVVLNLPACNARTIAEHTIMLMLAVQRGLVESAVAVRNGDWASRGSFDRDELAGRTLGVIGLGNIGGRVATIATALGMRVIYADPHPHECGYEHRSLPDLLADADVVTLHCQLDESTRGLIDAAALGRMKPGAVLINTARGPIVDHGAVATCLASGALAGYGSDVLDIEPPPADHPLLSAPNAIITPHVGSLTRTTYREICVRSVRNVLAVLRGDEPEAGCRFNGPDLDRG